MPIRPEDFGAVGNGTTDDTIALQNWLNALSSDPIGLLSAKTYLFKSALTAPLVDNRSIIGENPYSSKLLYGGTSTALDFITIGSDSVETTGWLLRDFAIDSNTQMTSGSALRLIKCIFCAYDGVTLAGQYSGSQINANHKLWDGVYFDGYYYSTWKRSDIKTRNEGIKLRGRNVSGSARYSAGLVITDGKIAGCKTGIHAGGDGCCFVVDNIDIIANTQDGILIDTAYGTIGNNQIFFGSGLTVDTNGRDGIRVDDSLQGWQYLQLDGTWSASNSQNGINILNWGLNGKIKLADCIFLNNVSAGIRISTATPRITISDGIAELNGTVGLVRTGTPPGRPNNVSVRGLRFDNNVSGYSGQFDGLSESYTPTITPSAGSFATSPTIGYAFYNISENVGVGRKIHIRLKIQFGTNGTASGAIFASIPYPAAGSLQRFYITGLNRTTGTPLIGIIDAANMQIYTNTMGYAGGTNHLIELSGIYETD